MNIMPAMHAAFGESTRLYRDRDLKNAFPYNDLLGGNHFLKYILVPNAEPE